MNTETPMGGLRHATTADIPAIVTLMNRAYRGEGGEAGWSHEITYIDGSRTSERLLRDEWLRGLRRSFCSGDCLPDLC